MPPHNFCHPASHKNILTNSFIYTGSTCNVDILSASAEEDFQSQASSYKSLENIGVCIVNDQYMGDDVLPIGTSAKRLHDLLVGKYGYKMLTDPFSGKTVLENIKDEPSRPLDLLLDGMLTKWKEGEGTGARVDRFLLYYHGHGVQVSGQPCLLTPDWETIPILELVNQIAELVTAERYYIVTDCCANRRDWEDEKAKQRVEEAEDAQQHKTLVERIVNISAVPGGYKASAEEDKTLTCALVSVLESCLEAKERGIPLGDLEERLREEQDKQNSRNYPLVKAGSLSFKLAMGIFPV